MKTHHLLPIAAFALSGLTVSAFAQAGTVTNAAAPSTEAPPAQFNAPTPAPNQIVYRASLPSPQEISNAASAQGLTVEQINQSAGQVVAVYKTKNGQTMTVAYALLPTAGGAAYAQAGSPSGVSPQTVAAVEYAPAGTVVSTGSPASTTVVYTDPYYYDAAYSPWYYGYGWGYPGIALGIGFGGYYSHGYYHGGYYRGGYYHGGRPGVAHPGIAHPGPARAASGFHSGGGFHH